MRRDLVEAALQRHKENPASILDGGDGSARVAIEYRRDNPGCSDADVQRAVARFRGYWLLKGRRLPFEE